MTGAGDRLSKDRRKLARALTRVENRDPGHEALLAEAVRSSGRAHRIGITGAPGVGKSTLVAALVRALRKRGRTVGILAVDPSSPVSGGALLGDRIRAGDLPMDEGVFFRSCASRGAHGGLSPCAGEQLDLLDGAGFDAVLVETVGAGQADADVASESDTTLLVFAPGAGDGIQAMKSGVMDVADLFVVNKSDDDRASGLAAQIAAALSLRESAPPDGIESRVLLVAARFDRGIEELVDRIDEHRRAAGGDGSLRARRRARWHRRVLRCGEERFRSAFEAGLPATEAVIDALESGGARVDPVAREALLRAAAADGGAS